MSAQVLGNYKLLRPLGVGGMGQVFLAEHLVLGRRAAIKVLHPELCRESEAVARFFNEARASAALHHPGLIDVYDFGKDGEGNAFIVMELLEGVSLRDLLVRTKILPPALAIGLARQVADAMSTAHAHGIVHRDLKPENLFLVNDAQIPLGWRAKVLDFGIAKLYGGSLQNAITTRTGNILGTPTYMAPEQCHGASHVDSRCDIYSLGCILFEMLCGRPPFDSEGVGAVIAAHMFEAPPLPSDLQPDLALEIDQAVLALLAKAPEQRPQTMPDVVALLEGLATADLTDQPELLAWSHTLATGTAQNPMPGSVSGTPPRGPRTPRGSAPPPLAGRPSREAPAVLPGSLSKAVVVMPGSVAGSLPRPSTSTPTLRTPISLPQAPPGQLEEPRLNTLDAAVVAVDPRAAASRRRRWRAPLVAALGVGVLGAGSIFALHTRQETARTPTLMHAMEVSPPPVTLPVPRPAPVPPAALPDAAAPLPVADSVSIHIVTQPADALVTREQDGVVLGRTPLELHLPRGSGHLAVAIEKDGFRTTRAEVALEEDGRADVELVPAPAQKPSRRHGKSARTTAAPAAPAPTTPPPAPPIKDGTLDPYGN